jgi:uncharacterized protein (TIGR00296 family)
MCEVCFKVILAKIKNENERPILEWFAASCGFSAVRSPVFVTWQSKCGSDYDLRGCIGTFDGSQTIAEVVPAYAKVAAFEDDRFGPIRLNEIPSLKVSVSLLLNFQAIEDPFAFEIGRHGVELDFRANGQDYGATFLPEVMSEEGWNQADTIANLI